MCMTLYIFFDRIDEFITTNNVIRMECQWSIHWRKSKMIYYKICIYYINNKFIFKEKRLIKMQKGDDNTMITLFL